MIDQWSTSIVRIFSTSGKTLVGAGFLASETHLFTCTQVVAQALALPETISETPTNAVRLDFPLAAPGKLLTAHVVRWRPEADEHIAVLELEDAPPEAARLAPLVVAEDVWQHRIRIFGFPSERQEGRWIAGELQDKQNNGWVQIQASTHTSVRLSPSFSGTPVWDEQEGGVIGMVFATKERADIRGAAVIPTLTLLHTWPELRRPITQDFKAYLETSITRLSLLPAYFPDHLDFDHSHQPISVIQDPPHYREEDAHIHEADRRAGYFDEEERVYHGEDTGRYERPKGEHKVMPWDKIRRHLRRAVVLGDPGFGKSWLLHSEGREMAREQLNKLQEGEQVPDTLMVPICLHLGALAEAMFRSSLDVDEAIMQLLREEYHLPERFVVWVSQQLRRPQCLLLLDALNEVVAEHKSAFLEALRGFAERSHCRMLLTSRIVGYQGAPFALRGSRQACEFELIAFNRKQVTDFVAHWFATDQAQGKWLRENVRHVSTLRSFVRIPLQLSLLCWIASESEEIPTHRAKLYERALHLFLQGAWRRDQLHEQREPDLFSFPSFQEYLVARSLASQHSEQWQEQVQAHCWFDPDWMGVIVLLAGCLQDPNALLETLLHEPHDAFHAMLLLAGRCFVEVDVGVVKQELAEQILRQLMTLLHSASRRDRRQAVLVLGKLGDAAVPELLAVLRNRNEHWEVRSAALEALGEMNNLQAIEDLLTLVRDKDEGREVHSMAVWALGHMSDPQTGKEVLAVLQDQDEAWEVRTAAAEALGEMRDLGAVEGLLSVLQDRQDNVYLNSLHPAAVEALKQIGEPALKALLKMLRKKSRRARLDAVHTLGMLGASQSVLELLSILQDKNERSEVRVQVAWALGQIGDLRAVNPLITTLQDQDDHLGGAQCSHLGLGTVG